MSTTRRENDYFPSIFMDRQERTRHPTEGGRFANHLAYSRAKRIPRPFFYFRKFHFFHFKKEKNLH